MHFFAEYIVDSILSKESKLPNYIILLNFWNSSVYIWVFLHLRHFIIDLWSRFSKVSAKIICCTHVFINNINIWQAISFWHISPKFLLYVKFYEHIFWHYWLKNSINLCHISRHTCAVFWLKEFQHKYSYNFIY